MPEAVSGPSRPADDPRGHNPVPGGAAGSAAEGVRAPDAGGGGGTPAGPVRRSHARATEEQSRQEAHEQNQQHFLQSETIALRPVPFSVLNGSGDS